MKELSEKELMVFLRSMASKNRVKIVDIIYSNASKCDLGEKTCCAGSTCVKDIAKQLKLANSTISHHVKALVGSGALILRVCGKYHYLAVNKEKFRAAKRVCARFSK